MRLRPDSATYTLSSAIDEEELFVVRDEAAWRDAWQRLHGRSRQAPPLPAVDFAHEMVAVAAMGQRMSGGYAIRLERAFREGRAIVIVVRREKPGHGCIVAMASTQPVDLARLPASPDAVEFRIEDSAQDCD